MAGKRKKDVHVGGLQLPMFDTPSDWRLPTELPDLSRAKYVGVDVEAHDPNLVKLGPGYIRRDAKVVGISLATDYGFKTYLPFGHATGDQLDKDQVVRYVQAQLSRPDQVKVGANLMYEFEALDSLGIQVRGPTYDVQIAEPLLDEERPEGYSLESLAQSYEGVGKSERLLEEAADNWGLDKKRQLWMLDPKYTGTYAEDDAWLPIQIVQKQLKRLEAEKLTEVWNLECELLPILWKMRKRGVRVDLDRAEALGKQIEQDENALLRQIWDEVEFRVDPWNSKSLFELFQRLGLSHVVGFTRPTKNHPDGQPSFTNEFFKFVADKHPVCKKLVDYRNMNKMRRDFVEGLVIGKSVDGRLHPQWHPLKSNDDDQENGTKTGRVASSKPNLTQIPARHPVWGPKVRSCFVADEGGRWCKHDFSQQEPRLTVHFGYLKDYEGAADARQQYIDNPDTDYHQLTADLIEARTGQSIGRGNAKNINLGSAYGMGKYKLAAKLGVDLETAEGILDAYHKGVPFVKKLEERCMDVVNGQGFIRTLLGRKRRFDSWEPASWKLRGKGVTHRDFREAQDMWGQVVRAFAHKALNAMIQGTAADQTKTAIVMLDREGLTPQIQVYDELNQTIYDDRSAWRIKEVMENALPSLTVPHLADPDVGPSWGEVDKYWAVNNAPPGVVVGKGG